MQQRTVRPVARPLLTPPKLRLRYLNNRPATALANPSRVPPLRPARALYYTQLSKGLARHVYDHPETAHYIPSNITTIIQPYQHDEILNHNYAILALSITM